MTDVRPLVVLDLVHVDEGAATAWAEVATELRRTGNVAAICIADQIDAQTRPAIEFDLGQKVRLVGHHEGASDVWKRRRDEQHVGIVIEHMPDAPVRVWDTVERDWWICDARHLEGVEP